MTDYETVTRLLTDNAEYERLRRTESPVCARCQDAPADPDGFYPDPCGPCTEVTYGEELTGDANV